MKIKRELQDHPGNFHWQIANKQYTPELLRNYIDQCTIKKKVNSSQ